MARQQRVSNERRKELEELDPFQENLIKAWQYIKTYKKQLSFIAIAFIAAIAIFSIVIFNIKSSGDKAAMLLNETLAKYSKTKDQKKAYLDVKDDFAKLFEDYSNTDSGKTAKIKFAKICYDAAEFAEAYKYYKSALSDLKKDKTIEELILASLGRTCLGLKNFKEAEGYFEKIIQGDNYMLKDEALFNLGMLAEKAGDNKTGNDFYKKLIKEYPGSLYTAMAKDKLN